MNKVIDVDKILNDANELNSDYLDNLASSNLSKENFKLIMKTKYEYIFKNHEAIFNICLSDKYDSNRLKFMLTMANQVRSGGISEHDASVKVGSELVENIVKPQLDKAGINPGN